MRRAASRSAAASVSVRRAGACHSSATRSCGSACLTTSAMPRPRTASTVPETPPASSSTVSSASAGTTPRRDEIGDDGVRRRASSRRLRGRPVVAIAGLARRVDRRASRSRRRARAARRDRRACPGSTSQIAIEVHARRDRVGDRRVVPGVDVGVDDRDELDEVDGLERRACDVSRRRRPRAGRARRRPRAARRRSRAPRPRARTGTRARSAPLQPGGDRDAAEQRVLGVEARQDGLVDRVAAAREAAERRRGGAAVALVAAVELRDRALLDASSSRSSSPSSTISQPAGTSSGTCAAAHERDRLAEQRPATRSSSSPRAR